MKDDARAARPKGRRGTAVQQEMVWGLLWQER